MENGKESTEKKFYQTNYFYFFIGFAVGIIILVIFGLTTANDEGKINTHASKETSELFPQDYRIVSPPIPSKLSFAGEKVPLDNFRIKERVDREFIVNTYFHSYTILAIKRINRWFPVIEPILKKNNIPDDFKYVCLIESGLTNVVSPAGAVGFWQLTEKAAKKYGLEVNKSIDERYNVIKSTEAACRYLNDSYNEFQSWTLAAASYNFGVDGLKKQMEKQHADNYYHLVLGEETERYIARVVALKTILNNPKEYGFYITKRDLYPALNTETITVNHTIKDLAVFAEEHGMDYATLKYYNPWLRDVEMPDKTGKVYNIILPDQKDMVTETEE